jgi:hypothetical protein
LGALDPEATCARLREIPDYEATGPASSATMAPILPGRACRLDRAQGAAVLCWTIRSPEAEAEARRIAQNVTFEGYRRGDPP